MGPRRFKVPRLFGRPAAPPMPERRLSPAGLRNIERIGFSGAGLRDVYHQLMTMSVPAMLGILAGIYVASSIAFTLLYLAIGDGIGRVRHDSALNTFLDTFFFSVQTMATIGYGEMYPKSTAANLIAAAETVYGLLSVTMSTGIFFSRFSMPTARVLFSRVAVVTPHNGVPTLMFRVANQRRNQILEAHMALTILRPEMSAEGVVMRRFHNLHLTRSQSVVFALTWTVMHPIDEHSPLYGMTAADLEREDLEFICSLTGIDDTFSQTVHARHIYGPEDLRWNARFVDILGSHPEGRRYIDYTRFHDVAL
jgi:inward rectifier potassium channel